MSVRSRLSKLNSRRLSISVIPQKWKAGLGMRGEEPLSSPTKRRGSTLGFEITRGPSSGDETEAEEDGVAMDFADMIREGGRATPEPAEGGFKRVKTLKDLIPEVGKLFIGGRRDPNAHTINSFADDYESQERRADLCESIGTRDFRSDEPRH